MSRLLNSLHSWRPSKPSLTWANNFVDERVAEVICCVYPTRIGFVHPTTTLLALGDDGFGLDKAELGLRLERTFGIIIPPEEGEKWNTVADVIDSVRRQTGTHT